MAGSGAFRLRIGGSLVVADLVVERVVPVPSYVSAALDLEPGAVLPMIATVLTRGDPRRILVPFMHEPHVLQMMRGLAEKAIVVAGKPPERWADEDEGDRAFFEDVLSVEGPRSMDEVGYRRAA